MLAVLQMSLLVAFLLATGALMTLAALNRLRVRPIRFSWYRGRSFIFWPGGFLFVVLILTVYAAFEQDYRLMGLGLGYTLGALCWCLAVRMSCAVMVTDFRLIRSLGDPRDVLDWQRVEDFFVTAGERSQQYVFFFRDDYGQRMRFELDVPRAHEERFRKLVSRLVENRDMHTIAQAFG
ncbi:MAG: hypothetical protein R2834_09000 [Rhodothermales bacterium]